MCCTSCFSNHQVPNCAVLENPSRQNKVRRARARNSVGVSASFRIVDMIPHGVPQHPTGPKPGHDIGTGPVLACGTGCQIMLPAICSWHTRRFFRKGSG